MVRVRGVRRCALLLVGSVALIAAAGCGPRPVLTVNGTALSEKEFSELCETATQIQPQRGTVGQQVLLQWIEARLFEAAAKKDNLLPTDADVDRRVDAFRKRASFSGGDFNQGLASQGVTEAIFRREMKAGMTKENVLLKGIQVTDAEVEKAFNENKKGMTIPATLKIRQITVLDAKKLQEAQRDLGSNTNFALVASTYSKDVFAQQGGEVPFAVGPQVEPGGPVVQPVVDAAFKLKPQEVSPPIKVGNTWVIVKVEERTEEKVPSIDVYREFIKADIRSQKARTLPQTQQEQIRTSLQAVFKEAEVKIQRPEYQHLESVVRGMAGGDPAAAAGGAAPPPPPAQ